MAWSINVPCPAIKVVISIFQSVPESVIETTRYIPITLLLPTSVICK